MSYRQQGYGFSAECQSKIAAKYSQDDEKKCCNWIAQITNEKPPQLGKEVSFFFFLVKKKILYYKKFES